MKIKNLRKKIDIIDDQMLKLLNSRADLAKKIGEEKKNRNIDFYSPHREKKIINRIIAHNPGVLPDKVIADIFMEILHACRLLQKRLRIAYFGPEATFTHLAAIKRFGNSAGFIPVRSISDVFGYVDRSHADYGVVPIENSTEGVVNHTLDMFIDSDLVICSEIFLEISHNLLSRSPRARIKRIYSHPQVIAQTRNWIENNFPRAELIEVASTARASELAVKDPGSAAIASEVAAKLYGLNILASRIEDNANNFTRFFVIGKNFPSKSGDDRTSIMFSIKDRVGALHGILLPFKKKKINLTKIESRPSKRKPWEYIFFVDFQGHVEDPKIRYLLKELEKDTVFLRILGSYPAGDLK